LQEFPDAVHVGPDDLCPSRQCLDGSDAEPFNNRGENCELSLIVQGIEPVIEDET
jgi:hypothetical protein